MPRHVDANEVLTTRNTSTIKRRIALIAGLNYQGSNVQLNGCETDAGRMNNFLTRIGYETIVMTHTASVAQSNPNLRPTKINFLKMIQNISNTTEMTDFFIFFAGHGTQRRDRSGDEQDGYDEVLVFHPERGPSRPPGQDDMLLDDELTSVLKGLFAMREVNLHLMFDACHSWTVIDLHSVIFPTQSINERGLKKSEGEKWSVVAVSASSDSECAGEAETGGFFTTKFLHAASNGAPTLSALARSFSSMGMQTPHISVAQPTSESSRFGLEIIENSTNMLRQLVRHLPAEEVSSSTRKLRAIRKLITGGKQ